MAKHEIRSLARVPEIRAVDDEARTIEGYAAVFNSPTVIAESFVEQIAPGAFDGVLGDDVRVLFNHDPSLLLGRTRSGTATVEVDEVGLRYRVMLPETTLGADVHTLTQRGDLDGSSFAFTIAEDEWAAGEDGTLPTRTITRLATLNDVSPVTTPAYESTTAEARAAAAHATGPDTDTATARRRSQLARNVIS